MEAIPHDQDLLALMLRSRRWPTKPSKITLVADTGVAKMTPILVAHKNSHYILRMVGVSKGILLLKPSQIRLELSATFQLASSGQTIQPIPAQIADTKWQWPTMLSAIFVSTLHLYTYIPSAIMTLPQKFHII